MRQGRCLPLPEVGGEGQEEYIACGQAGLQSEGKRLSLSLGKSEVRGGRL